MGVRDSAVQAGWVRELPIAELKGNRRGAEVAETHAEEMQLCISAVFDSQPAMRNFFSAAASAPSATRRLHFAFAPK
jgi:hypothetical protein